MWLRHYKIHDHLGNIRSVIKDFGTGNYEIASQYDYAHFGGVLSNSGEDERQTFIGNTWSWELGSGNWIFPPLASRSKTLTWLFSK